MEFPLLKRYRHVNLVLVDQAVVSGVNFFTGILIARYLGVEEYGRFTLVWMAVLFFYGMQMAVISTPMMSLGPKQGKEEPLYYGAMLVHQAIFSSISFLVVWVGIKASAFLYPKWNIVHLGLPLATVVFFFQGQDFLRRQFLTRSRQADALVNDLISYLGQLALLVCLFRITTLTVAGVLWAIAGTSAVAVLLGLFSSGTVRWSVDTFHKTCNQHWHFSKWMAASAVTYWFTGNIFLIITGWLLGAAAVGAIRAAMNVMAVCHILFQGMENIVPSSASRCLHYAGHAAMLRYLVRVTLYGEGATIIIALVVWCFPTFWLKLIYGSQYIDYGFVVRWYAITCPLIFLAFPANVCLRAMEQTRPIFTSVVATAFFSIITAIPLIDRFHVHGAMLGLFSISTITALWLGIAALKAIRQTAR